MAEVEVVVVDTVPEVVMTRTRAAVMAAVVSRATTRKNKNDRRTNIAFPIGRL